MNIWQEYFFDILFPPGNNLTSFPRLFIEEKKIIKSASKYRQIIKLFEKCLRY